MRLTKGGRMTNATTKFFEAVKVRGHEPRLERVRGTLRFDLTNGKQTNRWLIAIDKGDIAVSHRNARADCVVRTESAVFERIASGDTNAVTAVLRGEMAVEGDPQVLVQFRRLFSAPRRQS
jgi:putative sterol carrier protein